MTQQRSKYIFVTGGVASALGKGITSASLGRLLRSRGWRVTMLKFDPYVNVDAGTMNPFQHGEVFVTDDGAETDMDLGHYERFIDENLSRDNNTTTGKIYAAVIARERRGEYLGATVQVIPHVTNEIRDEIVRVARTQGADIIIVEVGGTVGDIESLPFLEAIRQFKFHVGEENVMYVHVSLVPYLRGAGELKTKPTQHSVKELRGIGIQPDVIICRTERPLGRGLRDKLALFCDVPPEAVIQAVDASSIYEVPLILEEEGLPLIVERRLRLAARTPDLAEWRAMVERLRHPSATVRIVLVGKYMGNEDSYVSIDEALRHGGIAAGSRVVISKQDSEELEGLDERSVAGRLAGYDGILVCPGFGARGVEGKVKAVRFAREQRIPFLGDCYGMQWAVVEFARHVCGLEGASTTEVDPATPHPVIDLLPEQKAVTDKGGTMRLGLYPCRLTPGSRAGEAYGVPEVQERHRHRFEVNNDYLPILTQHGLRVTGLYPHRELVEIIELADHPWFVGTQFHAEYRSRPTRPHPIYREFIAASLRHAQHRAALAPKEPSSPAANR
ncbi:MAG: CTP synthase [Bacillati bacterium ANGP1]|uniref:CTP synthase n=1 Tax=Candidatus Segetimicrobium genomatis TaxID=2569760 RepID=A0A537LXL8_9BACT|nr:MAG: CTP synthase [Terrabacteria group bacterium ANGP1]